MSARIPNSASVKFDKAYPVFPLEQAVLFPNTIFPLHLFETRSIKMAEDLIDSCGLLAIGQFRTKPTTEDYLDGTPLLRRDVGLGQIINYEKTEDGRYVLLLYGLCRAHIASEIPHAPYRKMHLTPYDLEQGNEETLQPIRLRIEGLLKRLVHDSTHEPVEKLRFRPNTPTKAIVDQVIDAICRDPEQRYKMLHEDQVQRRAEWLIGYLQTHV